MINTVQTITPGRICLLGDKADLLGYPVIASAISLKLKIVLEKNNDEVIRFFSSDLNKEEIFTNYPIVIKGEFKYLIAVYNRLKKFITSGFNVKISSNIPIGSGLSSSAAITVGFIKALNKIYNINLSDSKIAELAYQAEHTDCKISCGRMDQYSIAYGGVTYIDTLTPSVERLNINSLPIIIANSNEPRSAKSVLNETMDLINKKHEKTINCFKTVYQGVVNGKSALINKDFKKLGELMNIQQVVENEFNNYLSTPSATSKLNLLCKTAINNGALGAKQMGAGGGGCMIALAIKNREEIIKALEKKGATVYSVDIFNY
jgi:mevalonate kinase